MSWLFMFSAHRDLFERAVSAESKIVERDRTIYDLSKQLEAKMPAEPPTAEAVWNDFSQHALVEIPYPDGKVPDEAWLTPKYVE